MKRPPCALPLLLGQVWAIWKELAEPLSGQDSFWGYLAVQQGKCEGSGCTGIGVKADGSRDFQKSINGNIKGKVNATTTNTKAALKPDDLVINYAAINGKTKKRSIIGYVISVFYILLGVSSVCYAFLKV